MVSLSIGRMHTQKYRKNLGLFCLYVPLLTDKGFHEAEISNLDLFIGKSYLLFSSLFSRIIK